MSGPPSLRDLRVLLGAAHRFADLSRRAILSRSRGFRARLKPDGSVVTDADLAAERALRRAIARRFPDHGILGEEFPPTQPRAEFQWILDPLDGTLSFSRGIPFYGTILALHRRGSALLGLIDHPGLGWRSSAARGLGAWKDGRRLRVGDLGRGKPIGREVVATGDRGHFDRCGAARGFDRLLRAHPQVRSYTDCIGHTLVASGSVAAMADYGLREWDIAATQVLIEEAGGRYVQAHRCERGGVARYGILFGKPRAVRWLSRFFR